MKDIDRYADFTDTTAIYPKEKELEYLALGLNGEAGEVAEKVKKLLRDGTFVVDDFERELGDVFWYLVRLCKAIGRNPSSVLQVNVEKLIERKERAVISGSGDYR